MDTMTIIPSRLGVGTIELGDDTVGLLRVTGSGSSANVGIDIVLSPAAIGEATALLAELRDGIVAERCR